MSNNATHWTAWTEWLCLLLVFMTNLLGSLFANQCVTMMVPSNGNIFLVTCPLWRESTGDQRPVTQSFDVFLYICLSKRLSKPSRRRWFDAPSRSLWRHCNDHVIVGTMANTSWTILVFLMEAYVLGTSPSARYMMSFVCSNSALCSTCTLETLQCYIECRIIANHDITGSDRISL